MPLILTRDEERFELEERLPVLPLRDVVIFPYMVIPLLVGRQASLAAVEAALAGDRWIFLVAQRTADTQDPAAADLFRVGVVGRVLQIARLANGTTKVLVEGVARAKVTRYAPSEQVLRANVTAFALEQPTGGVDERAMARRVVTLFEEYVVLHRRLPAEVVALVQGTEAREKQAFAIAAHMLVKLEQRQDFLQAASMATLFSLLADSLTSEIEILRLERKIEGEVRGSLFQNQREFYLQEQLKA
ncbi:MAG: LON peptidase substrate-binding domain-containing protein, partial [Gemmatimonadaceae bacterium]